MKVCLYGYGLATPGGGTSQYTKALGRQLVLEGHEVTVVTRRWANAVTVADGLKYHFLSVDSKGPSAARAVRYALKSVLFFSRHRKDFDLIHCMSGFQIFSLLSAFIRKQVKIPMVYSVLSPFSRRFYLSAFDQLVCVSRNIEERLGFPGSVYIPPFIEVDRFRNGLPYDWAGGSRFVIGTMGYPAHRKGFRYFVEAMPLILDRFPEASFVLAIDLPAMAYMEKLAEEKRLIERLIHQFGIEEKVKILGTVDAARFLHSIDLFVYPVQTTEGMIDIPPTVLECLAAGCGLVASSQGGIGEVVREGYNGSLVPLGEHARPRAYADRVTELLEDRGRLDRIRRGGPESVLDFDVKKVVPQIVKIYQKVLSRERPGP